MTLILNNEEITALVDMPACIEALEVAYRGLAAGSGVTRRRSDIVVQGTQPGSHYSLKSMDGVSPELGVGAVRINSDVVTYPEIGGKKRRVKVPAAPGERYVGLILLFSWETGEPLAIMPDGVVQRMRVGATNGLATRLLARPDTPEVGIIGSGWQAGAQLMAEAGRLRPAESWEFRARVYLPVTLPAYDAASEDTGSCRHKRKPRTGKGI